MAGARWLCVVVALLPILCRAAEPATVADPWEWLEQPSPQRDRWLEAEHATTADYLADDDISALMHQRIAQLWNHPRLQVVDIRGDQVFYYWNSGQASHYDLYSQPLADFLTGGVVAERMAADTGVSAVIGPGSDAYLWYDQSGTGSVPALLAAQVSPSGQRVAVLLEESAVSELPRDSSPPTAAWHILDSTDLRNARRIPAAAASLVWAGRGQGKGEGVYYAAGEHIYFADANAAGAPRSIMEVDGVIERLEWYGDHVLVGFYPARPEGQQAEWLKVDPATGRALANWRLTAYSPLPEYVGCRREHCYFVQAGESGNGELWQVPFYSDSAYSDSAYSGSAYSGSAGAARVILDRGFPLLQALVTEQETWLHYLEHGSSVVLRIDDSDARRGAAEIELPRGVRVDFLKRTDAGVILSYSGLVTPPTTALIAEVESGETSLWQNKPSSTLAPDSGLSVRLLLVASPDGTQVPVWLAGQSPEDLHSRPLLLEVYGGFGVPMELMHSVARQAWMEAGGLYAVAGPRGGGTYGTAWHAAGTGERRPDSVADVLAVAEDLRQRTTQPVFLTGASHGALLAIEAILERSDLFGGLVAAAGVYDLLRFPELGGNWKNEYGDPLLAADRARLAQASPYHQALDSSAEERQMWPPWLLITRDNDPVVNPAHSYKLHAARVAPEGGDREQPTSLLYRAGGAGHDAAGDPGDLIREYADRWAFLLRQTESP